MEEEAAEAAVMGAEVISCDARELHVTVSIIGASPVLWFANASPVKGSSAEAFAGRG